MPEPSISIAVETSSDRARHDRLSDESWRVIAIAARRITGLEDSADAEVTFEVAGTLDGVARGGGDPWLLGDERP
jgi:hypothetical protein